MSKGIRVLFITLAVVGIMALSLGGIAMAAGEGNADCDEACQQECLQAGERNQNSVCLNEQQQLRERNETCIQIAEQSHTRLNWTDGTCPGNVLGQQGENQAQGNRCGIS